MSIGVPLGLLIGVVTGLWVLLLLVNRLPPGLASSKAGVVGGLVGLPVFWFGGPWLLGPVLESIDWDKEQTPYVFTLAVTWIPFALLGTALRLLVVATLQRSANA